jgi:hypothetical protein
MVSPTFWEDAYREGRVDTSHEAAAKKLRMQHLLDLAVATIVRTIEMSRMERTEFDDRLRESIVRSYAEAFGRQPGEAELQGWLNRLASVPASYEELVGLHLEWRASDAGRGETIETVKRSYLQAFGRTPGDHETQDWVRRLQSDRLTYVQIVTAHLSWLRSTAGQAERRAVVTRSYVEAFGREPAASEAEAWTRRVETEPIDYAQLVHAHQMFIISPDSKASRMEMVDRAFRATSSRAPTSAEQAHWTARVANERLTYRALLALLK